MMSPELQLAESKESLPGRLTVLASDGTCLILRDDLRRSFAAWLAKSAAEATTGDPHFTCWFKAMPLRVIQILLFHMPE